MSDSNSPYALSGPPRRPDPRNMLAGNRTDDTNRDAAAMTPPAPAPEPDVEEEAPKADRQAPAPRARAPRKPAAARSSSVSISAPDAVDEPKEPVGGRVRISARARAIAAHRATAHLIGEASWSEFVENAILAEAARREQAHNEGAPFAAAVLHRGRPLGS